MSLFNEIDFNKEYKILFIGNSYTYFNELWNLVKNVCEKYNIKISVEEVTSGGYTLEKMNDVNDLFGNKVNSKLNENKYDVVVLQEQSFRPCIDKELFFEAVRNLHKKINRNGARTLLYETWGRKEGSVDLEKRNMTSNEMSSRLIEAYESIKDELGIYIASVGKAFQIINNEYKDIELYNEDKSHPSLLGSILSSLVISSVIFNIDINYYFNESLSKEINDIFIEVVKRVI